MNQASALICWSGGRSLLRASLPVRDHNNVGLDLPVEVDRCSTITPFAADFNVLVKLELWMGASDFLACLILGFLRSRSDAGIFPQKISVWCITFFACH
jgi:hypothetical protein